MVQLLLLLHAVVLLIAVVLLSVVVRVVCLVEILLLSKRWVLVLVREGLTGSADGISLRRLVGIYVHFINF